MLVIALVSLSLFFLSIGISINPVTVSAEPSPNFKYGDINGDSRVNVADYTLLRRFILEVITSFDYIYGEEAADVNADGQINVADYTLMRRYILEIINVFPAEVIPPVPTPTGNMNIMWDWTGIIGTGQSLSVGVTANLAKTTNQPYNNLKLSLGNLKVPPYDHANSALKMVPLVEPIRSVTSGFFGTYPTNIYGETPHTAMANQITSMVKKAGGDDYISTHTVVGESGQGMSVIKKGATDTGNSGRSYAASMFEINAINRLAKQSGKKYGVGGIIITHGETDFANTNYESELYKLWSDYNQDVKAITGQTQKISMFLVQQNSYPTTGTAVSTNAQWKAGVDYSEDITCIGPNYQRQYSNDSIHLTSSGYQQMGEKYGQVYFEKVVLGRDWKPLHPTSVSKNGRLITVNFHVPVPPLVWDNTLPAPNQSNLTEWKNGKGFEVSASGTRITISSVEISGNSVKITCANDLPTSGVKVGYAYTAGKSRPSGTVRWGQLCDSDPFKGSISSVPQPNYGVAFEISVP